MKTVEELYDGAENNWYLEEDEEGQVSGEKFDYHLLWGNAKIVFIKAGAGGSARGYKDKYVRMAERIHERLGATVICASNPMFPICDAPDATEIYRVASELGVTSFDLYLVGVSDGAYQNLKLAKQFTNTVQWMGINASYIDARDMEEKLKALPDVKKTLVYGDCDDDYDEVSACQFSKIAGVECVTIEGADHQFTDMLDEFIALADLLA